MRRMLISGTRLLLLALALLPVVAIGLVVLVAVGFETAPGQAALRAAIVRLGGIEIESLSGSPLRRTTVTGIVVHDDAGPWLRIDRLSLAWNPLALVRRSVEIDALEIAGPALLRLPQATAEPARAGTQGVSPAPEMLPVDVRIASLRIIDGRIAAVLLDAPEDTKFEGEARLSFDRSLRGNGALALRLSGNGDGRIDLDVTRGHTIAAKLVVSEPADGFLARLAGLPDLGAVDALVTVDGLAHAATVDARLAVGQGIVATLSGTLDTVGMDNDLRLAARADAPSLAVLLAGIAQVGAVDASLRITGALTDPALTGTFAVPEVVAAGGRVGGIYATFAALPGTAERSIDATVTAEDVAPPAQLAPLGPSRLTAKALLRADGGIVLRQARLENAHLRVTADGIVSSDGTASGNGRVSIASLRALLPETGMDGAIGADVALGPDGALTLDASLDGIDGPGPTATLLGPRATLVAAGRIAPTLQLARITLEGQAISLSGSGALGETITLEATVELPYLTALAPELHGTARARITASGSAADPSITLALAVPRIGVADLPDGSLELDATVTRSLSAPEAAVSGSGTLAGEPLRVALRLLPQPDGSLHLPEATVEWGDMRLATSGSILADGRPDLSAQLAAPSLARIGRLIGQPLAGAVTAELRLSPDSAGVTATLRADAAELALPGARIDTVSVQARADAALTTPVIDAIIDARGLAAGGIVTTAKLTARGPLKDLALGVALDGADHRLRADARFAMPATLRLSTLSARWQGESATLAAPATIKLAPEISVDRLALTLARGGRIEASGRAGDTLDLTVAVRRLPLSLATLVAPDLVVSGTLEADSRITGTVAAPEGRARIAIRGAGLEGTPRADVDADVTLTGGQARANARLRSGQAVRLALVATAPVSEPQNANGSLTGTIGLEVLDPWLAPEGRQARGQLRVDLLVQQRQLGGFIQIAQASISDAALGVRLDGIVGRITADGSTLRVDVGARAGDGRLAVTGTVTPLAPFLPIALRVTATDATLAIGTMLSTRFGADLAIDGEAARALGVRGRVDIERADVRLPERLPANIVALPVEVAGAPPSAPSATAAQVPITLDVMVQAPRAVFVRGQGLEAELGGRIKAMGTVAEPRLSGDLALRTGTLTRLGQTFDFRRGTITFDGAAGFDPSLDFEAARELPDMTALVRVTGRPSALTISLASDPEAPPDEVLSRILFGRAQASLTPAQLLQLASAAAELSGLTTPGGGIVDRVRSRLGLDRLSAGAGEAGGGEVEAGRYVADGVYVGARQRTDGSSQATIQLEVLPGVRLEADVGGEGSDRVGASFGFEY